MMISNQLREPRIGSIAAMDNGGVLRQCYLINNWSSIHETSTSVRVKNFDTVLIPNQNDSPEYLRLTRREDFVSVYFAWIQILRVASRMPQRGVLCNSNGPLDYEDIAFMTSSPTEIIKKSLEVLTDPRINFVKVGEAPTMLQTSGTGHRPDRPQEIISVQFPSTKQVMPCHPDSILSNLKTEGESLELIDKDDPHILECAARKQGCAKEEKEWKEKETKEKEENTPFSQNGDHAKQELDYKTKSGKSLSGEKLKNFLMFWEAYGLKLKKAEAADVFLELNPSDGDLELLVEAAGIEANIRRPQLAEIGQSPPLASSWLSDRRWEDEISDDSSVSTSTRSDADGPKGWEIVARDNWHCYILNPERAEELIRGGWKKLPDEYKKEIKDLLKT